MGCAVLEVKVLKTQRTCGHGARVLRPYMIVLRDRNFESPRCAICTGFFTSDAGCAAKSFLGRREFYRGEGRFIRLSHGTNTDSVSI